MDDRARIQKIAERIVTSSSHDQIEGKIVRALLAERRKALRENA
jgi:hypothetical protein